MSNGVPDHPALAEGQPCPCGRGASAQSGQLLPADTRRAGRADPSLSAECRVPDWKLFALARWEGVKAALDEKRPVKVFALGSSSTLGLGTGSASYPAWLEDELERLLPGSDFDMEHRGISGEIMEDAADRIKGTVAEVEPDLLIWQVGTNEALARTDTEEFAGSLDETLKWLKGHDIDVVLVDPQYTASLADDPGYKRVVASVEAVGGRMRSLSCFGPRRPAT